MRKTIVAGNWKMNIDFWEAKDLIDELLAYTEVTELPNTEVMIAPAFPFLHYAYDTSKDTKIEVAAQNMHVAENGAYTGEVSSKMLVSAGIKTVILGHSERRAIFGETDDLIKEKVDKALEKGMKVIFCNGEHLDERKAGNHFDIVKNQTEKALFHLSAEQMEQVVIAYEPVWAIGTGETASPEQAQEMHAAIRAQITDKYGKDTADKVRILYGGSVKPANAKEIFSQPDVDGGLVGGSSLKSEDFIGIIEASRN